LWWKFLPIQNPNESKSPRSPFPPFEMGEGRDGGVFNPYSHNAFHNLQVNYDAKTSPHLPYAKSPKRGDLEEVCWREFKKTGLLGT